MADKWSQYEEKDKWSEYEDKPTDKSGFVEGAKYGLSMAGLGLLQTIFEGGESIRQATGMESNAPAVRDIKGLIAEKRKLAPETTSGRVGEFVGGVVPTLAMPGGAQATLLRRLVTSGGQGAVIGGLQPTTEEESRATNAVVGGVFGVGGQGLVSGGGKLLNTATGKVPKNVIDKLSEKFKIRTTLGEATDNPITQTAETWLEKVPVVGLKKFREKQNEEAQSAAKGFLSKYIADPNATNIEATNREFSGRLFENLKTKIAGVQDQPIEPTNTKVAADELVKRYPDIFKKFQDTKREGIIQSIRRDTKDVQGLVLQQSGKPYEYPMTATFDEMWTLRSGLGEMIGQAKKKLASGEIDKTTYSELSKLYSAVNQDIDSWITKLGRNDIKGAISSANESYKNYTVKYNIIQKAYDKASGEAGANEVFSPKKFSTELKKIAYKDKQLKNFTQAEIDEITGLANIMQVVKRSGQYRENPSTGNRWGLLGAFGGAEGTAFMVGGGPAALKTGAFLLTTSAVAKFLTGTERGKILARAASKYEPNSPQMLGLVNIIYKNVPKSTSVLATQPSGGE
jgi:hypothetical protein